MREIKEAEMGEFRPFVKQGAARPHLVDDSQEREKFAVRDSGTISAAKRFADGVARFPADHANDRTESAIRIQAHPLE